MSSVQMTLAQEAVSVRTARRRVARFAALNRFEADVLMVIVSELVTNAVMHGGQPIVLCAEWDGRCVRIQVIDSDPNITVVRAATPDEGQIGGRGLRLVHAMCDRWGVTPHQDGKAVWAELEPGRAA